MRPQSSIWRPQYSWFGAKDRGAPGFQTRPPYSSKANVIQVKAPVPTVSNPQPPVWCPCMWKTRVLVFVPPRPATYSAFLRELVGQMLNRTCCLAGKLCQFCQQFVCASCCDGGELRVFFAQHRKTQYQLVSVNPVPITGVDFLNWLGDLVFDDNHKENKTIRCSHFPVSLWSWLFLC